MENNQQRNLKLVFIIARFRPFKGGAEENCYQLAKRTAAAGHEVTVLTTDANTDSTKLHQIEIIDGIKVVRVHRWNQQLNLGFYPKLLPTLLNTPADVVHVENGPGFLWHDLCIFIKRLKSPSTKFITTPHGPFLAVSNTTSNIKSGLIQICKFVMAPYFKFLWGRQWDAVIQVNPNQQAWLVRDYGINPAKIWLVPNGIESRLIITQKPNPSAQVEMTYLGRVSWYKGIHKVLFALKELQEEKLPMRFTVMGKTFHPEIKALAQKLELDNVRFVESPTDEERDRILTEESQIHILPSQWEATGIGLLEAMAKGNAVVTTSGNEAATLLITPGENGYIYNYENTLDLVEIIRKLVQNGELRNNMIAANLNKIHEFTWEAIAPKYLNLIQFDQKIPT
jgi:glycosyltransferase involved in cell wall biosynthesis